jgi:hypothetical protein
MSTYLAVKTIGEPAKQTGGGYHWARKQVAGRLSEKSKG